jgi:hypothetical protein
MLSEKLWGTSPTFDLSMARLTRLLALCAIAGGASGVTSQRRELAEKHDIVDVIEGSHVSTGSPKQAAWACTTAVVGDRRTARLIIMCSRLP